MTIGEWIGWFTVAADGLVFLIFLVGLVYIIHLIVANEREGRE